MRNQGPMKNALPLAAIAVLAAGFAVSSFAGDRQEERAAFVGESALPEGALGSLGQAERKAVLEAMNAESCGCGAPSLAACRASGVPCPHSHRAFAQAIELARLGNDATAIRAALARAPTAETAPLAAQARIGQHEGHPHDHGSHEDSSEPGNN